MLAEAPGGETTTLAQAGDSTDDTAEGIEGGGRRDDDSALVPPTSASHQYSWYRPLPLSSLLPPPRDEGERSSSRVVSGPATSGHITGAPWLSLPLTVAGEMGSTAPQ